LVQFGIATVEFYAKEVVRVEWIIVRTFISRMLMGGVYFLRFVGGMSIAEGARIESPLAPRGVRCRERAQGPCPSLENLLII